MITFVLIGIISVVSFVAFSNRTIFHKGLFNPYLIREKNQWYRFFTHAFLHADFTHLIFNMLTLFFFGGMVEYNFNRYFGDKGDLLYIVFFFTAALCSSIPAYYKQRDNIMYNAVGASGAVSAILFAGILFDPLMKIYIFFIPIGIPAVIFGVLYLILSARMAKRATDNVAHDTHFWGSVYGFIFPLAINYQLIFVFIDQIKHGINHF
ncbi:MAG: rhomboid family intramembrane serine protease [Bacteroidetes bacterium HGW-Bacteroidetes-21]|jgi:membrane associated rhomboid family serine protease|nr:MAG: rhomboid family intramembrane serine protease [Bacteroidetes bacterium HGW-Bacteroidetes-21]